MRNLTSLRVAAGFNTVGLSQDVGGMRAYPCAHMMTEALLLARQFGTGGL